MEPDDLKELDSACMAGYIRTRSMEPAKKPDSRVSAATINEELRHLKAVLRIAHEWKFLAEVPAITSVREVEDVKRYVTPEHFADIYDACEHARRPARRACPARDWWRALLVFMYPATGWPKMEPLSLRWQDVDLVRGQVVLRGKNAKALRGEVVPLHPMVVEHLKRIQPVGETVLSLKRHENRRVFDWPHHERTLDVEFHRIQKVAGIELCCEKEEEHTYTSTCHVYGFHDIRRGFATMNAGGRLTPDALQRLMRHSSYTTTQKYINLGRHIDEAVAALYVPDELKKAGAGL